jgi:hypothetical protein
MLVFNGKKYAKNNNELVSSLFHPCGTCNGLYKTSSNGTHLYRPTGELFAYIVHNDKQGYFVVTAHMDNGKKRYMFALCSVDEKYLGLSGIGKCETEQIIKRDCQRR